jgi:hypothetical protein
MFRHRGAILMEFKLVGFVFLYSKQLPEDGTSVPKHVAV